MNKPLLIVITGRPASGKSTLAATLAKNLHFPLVSRDELKEGYLQTLRRNHDSLDKSPDLHVYRVFFEVIGLLISQGISVVVEAAFQDHLWRPQLLPLQEKAQIKAIICELEPFIARKRFESRRLANPSRDIFHGDNSVRQNAGLQTDTYVRLDMAIPTLFVNTRDQYRPAIQEIQDFIRKD